MALTKVTGQVIKNTTDVTVGVLTVTNTLAVGGTVSIGGTLTYEDVTNVDAVGLITARNGIVVGSGITLSKDGDGFFTGVVTATSYAGDGSALTGIDATQIVTGNTSVQTVDTGSDGHVIVNTEGSERLRIIADGKVGVNKTAPNFHLDVAGNIGLTEGQVITWHDGSGTKAGDMYIDSSDNFIIRNTCRGSERLRIDSSGRLGIGTASGTRGLNVEGTGTASRLFVNDSTNHKAVEFGADSTGSFQSTFGDNPHLIYTNGTERARFTSDGLKFPNTKGIDFSASAGSNATSSLFDDYEEGTWTPSFSAGETLSIYSARYTKIGRLVTANCYIYNFSDLSGNTNSFNIEGLPYSASGGNYHGGGMIGYAYVMNYGYPLLPLVSQNTNIGYFHRQDGTGSAWRYVDMHNVGNGSGGQLIVTFVYETST